MALLQETKCRQTRWKRKLLYGTKAALEKPGSGLWKVKQGVDDCKLHQAEQSFYQMELETDFTFFVLVLYIIFRNLALYIVFRPEVKTENLRKTKTTQVASQTSMALV